MSTKFEILLINGPNLNMLGRREPEVYGAQTLDQLVASMQQQAQQFNIKLTHFQSNAEHELINTIHQADVDFILINPAAFTHTSIALRDALLSVHIPFIELHISNIHNRETFRAHSYLSDIAQGVICGFGTTSYQLALIAANDWLISKDHQQN